MVRRSTAKVGDVVVVTGTIGDAALGLLRHKDNIFDKRWRCRTSKATHLKVRYLLPEPRNALAEAVLRHASAAMDVSDGLVGDLAKLCRASGVAAEIDVARVPLSEAAQAALAADPTLIETILTGGDDYEILLTLPPQRLDAFRAAAQRPISRSPRSAASLRGGRSLHSRRQGADLRAAVLQSFLTVPTMRAATVAAALFGTSCLAFILLPPSAAYRSGFAAGRGRFRSGRLHAGA
jgi:hypothetical protein